jgi:hypothetical protein
VPIADLVGQEISIPHRFKFVSALVLHADTAPTLARVRF